ncbi:GL19686 [Drosophila persimilis]|uniref:GL19686 n=1 Tax=Drosophila persimilis TaxID=7234 RepID=B4IRF6_DROPE|nr:GL19686 [Drosophila persimilis]
MNNPTDEERYHADPLFEEPGDEARHFEELQFNNLRYGGEILDGAGPGPGRGPGRGPGPGPGPGPGEADYQPGTVLYTWKPELFATLKPYFNLTPPRLLGEAAERPEQVYYGVRVEPLSDDMKIQLLEEQDGRWANNY